MVQLTKIYSNIKWYLQYGENRSKLGFFKKAKKNIFCYLKCTSLERVSS